MTGGRGFSSLAPVYSSVRPLQCAWFLRGLAPAHTQLPWCPAAEAQRVPPVPGGQQLPPAPTTHVHIHTHVHTLAGSGSSVPQIGHLAMNSFPDTLEYRFPASSTDSSIAISLPFVNLMAVPHPKGSGSQSRGGGDSSLSTLSQTYK